MESNRITEITRQGIVDGILASKMYWWGKLDDASFLSRLYNLDEMPSLDTRFDRAALDIWQHRENNYDWDNDWVFGDPRFNLIAGPDQDFLKFLCETVHPVVRSDSTEVRRLVELYNQYLRVDGYEIVLIDDISGHPVFGAQRVTIGSGTALRVAKSALASLNTDYVTKQILRMEKAIDSDPELAIGTAKELVETCCKTVLNERGIAVSKDWDVPKLVKETVKHLQVTPGDIPDMVPAAETIRKLLQNLGVIASSLAELRNSYGSGHGRVASSNGLQPRHARVAVGAASTLAIFLLETYQLRKEK